MGLLVGCTLKAKPSVFGVWASSSFVLSEEGVWEGRDFGVFVLPIRDVQTASVDLFRAVLRSTSPTE